MRSDQDSGGSGSSWPAVGGDPWSQDSAWPAGWPASPESSEAKRDEPDAVLARLNAAAFAGGPRWPVPVRGAIGFAVVAVAVIVTAALLLLHGRPSSTVVDASAPAGSPTEGTSMTVGNAGSPVTDATPVASVPATGVVGASALASGTDAVGAEVRVYVVGQVRHPGVVSVPADARVEDAVSAAGGATGGADLTAINLAQKIVDGEQILVPKPGQTLPAGPLGAGDPGGPGSGAGDAATSGGADAGAGPTTPIDLNTASAQQLDTLPGVGPVLAGRIVAWRQQNGRFASVDDLGEVSGIGDAILARLRPLVRV